MNVSFSVEIEGETYTHLSHKLNDEYSKSKQGRVSVPRDEIRGQTFDLGNTVVTILRDGDPYFGGILTKRKQSGAASTLTVASFEQYAQEAEPLNAALILSGSDGSIFQEILQKAPVLTPGTIDSTTNNLKLKASKATPARLLRKLRDITGNFIQYNPDGTVDYLSDIGETRDEVLSPQRQNFAGMDIDEMSGNTKESAGNVTNVKMFGAGDGGNQLEVNVSVNDLDDVEESYDPDTDRQRWRSFTDKSIENGDTLRTKAETLLRDIRTPSLRVKGQAYDVNINVGDEFLFVNGRENFRESLSVSKITETVDDNGLVTQVKASNNNVSDIDEAQETRGSVEDLQKGQTARSGKTNVTEDLTSLVDSVGNIVYLQVDNEDRGVYHFNHLTGEYERGTNSTISELQQAKLANMTEKRLKDLDEFDLDLSTTEDRPSQLKNGSDVIYDVSTGLNGDTLADPLGSISNFPLKRGEDVEEADFDFGYIKADPSESTPYTESVSADFTPRYVEFFAVVHPSDVGSTYVSPANGPGSENATGFSKGLVKYDDAGQVDSEAVVWQASSSGSPKAHRSNMSNGEVIRLAYLSNNGEVLEGYTVLSANGTISGGFEVEWISNHKKNPVLWKAYR